MKIKWILLTAFYPVSLLIGQQLYPDSAVIIGHSRYGSATGGYGGNRISVRDSWGNIHSVFCYIRGAPFADSSGIYYVFSTNNGFTWSSPENISQCDSQSSEEPNLTIDSRNRLHCIWKQFYNDTSTSYYDYDLYYSRKDSSGWTSSVNISNQHLGWEACYSSMVVDSRDYIHVIWDMYQGYGTDFDIYYSYFNDTIWTVPYQVSNTTYDDACPALTIDKNDHLHAAWRQRTSNGPIYYSNFNDSSWTPPGIIASIPNSQSGGPCIVVDSLNHPHVIFNNATLPNDSNEIYYIYYNGSTWSSPVNLSNTAHPSWGHSLTIDSLDKLYLVWTEKVDSNPDADYEIYYRIKNNLGWSTAVNLSQDTVTSNCAKLGNPILLNRIDLIWVSGSYNTPGSYDIVYYGINPSSVQVHRKKDISIPIITAHPNPFRVSTILSHPITKFTKTGRKSIIRIYDISGRIVKIISEREFNIKGYYCWSGDDYDGRKLSSGVYFIHWLDNNSDFIKIVKLQ